MFGYGQGEIDSGGSSNPTEDSVKGFVVIIELSKLSESFIASILISMSYEFVSSTILGFSSSSSSI